MKPISEVSFRVIDKGIFLPIARKLGIGSKVTYWTPHETAFPKLKDQIGDGFSEIERVESPWTDAGSVDCWVFPDVGFSDLQAELLRQGKLVWGPRRGCQLEVMRGKFIDALMQTDLPVPKYKKIVGMTELRDFLKDKEDKFIKISKYRGDWETLHFKNWAESECELDRRTVVLGPWKELMPFYVFDNIETEIEDGCDTWCIDGQFPSIVIHGMEAKDKAYIGAFQKYADLPEEVRRVHEAFGPILGSYDYRSFFSSEVRITKDGESYFIDPTCRAGSPPCQVMCEMIGNLPEIIWGGAQGEIVEPEPQFKFGIQAIVCVSGDPRKSWRTLELPSELSSWFKPGISCKIANRICFPPDPDTTDKDVGWMLGVGDSIDEAIMHLKQNAETIEPDAHVNIAAVSDLLKEVQQAEQAGMEFTDQTVPEPASVLKDTT